MAEPTNLVHDLKMVKSPAELAYIREAARIADDAMAVFAKALRAGRSELSIAGEVYQALMAAGGGIAASPINLVSGERSGFSHGAPTQRLLEEGDFGSVEYGATWKRYTATIGRQFVLGRPSPRMLELYEVVRHAQDACIAAIRAGVPATVPHEAARRVIADAGLDEHRVHTTGYGLAPGFPPSWGEPVHMFDDSPYTLEAGMVLSVEPPVFIAGERLGARLIDKRAGHQGRRRAALTPWPGSHHRRLRTPGTFQAMVPSGPAPTDERADMRGTIQGRDALAERRERGGTREVGGDPHLEPEPACGLLHRLVAHQHDAVDGLPDDIEDALIGPGTGHGRHDGRDPGQGHELAGFKTGMKRRRARGLDADDADPGLTGTKRRRHPGDQATAADGDQDGIHVRQVVQHLEAERALPRTTSGSAKGWK